MLILNQISYEEMDIRAKIFARIFALIFFQFLCNYNSVAQSLEQRISISVKDESLPQVFKKIRQETGLSFTFPDKVKTIKVSLDYTDIAIKELLNLALKGTSLQYRVKGARVVIYKIPDPKPSENKLGINEIEKEQNIRSAIIGQVSESSSLQPLPGVNIVVKGTNRGTASDANGEFAIEASGNETLVFTYIGYKTVEFQILEHSTARIEMDPDIFALKPVEVVGTTYWSTDKVKSTSSIIKIKADDIEKQPVTSPLLALQGRVAGLEINPTTGAPGDAPVIRIRGNNSLRPEGGYPLYIIDGIPIDPIPINSAGRLVPNGFDPLATLNPTDIESIEILKDGDATAIYGSRGANGVIVIKTKRRSSKENTSINIDMYTGIGEVGKKIEVLSREQYLEMRKEAFRNLNQTPNSLTGYDLTNWDTTRTTDWQNVLMGGTSRINEAQATISGGYNNTNFQFHGGYHQETLVVGDEFGFKRLNGKLRADHSSSNGNFNTSFSLTYGLQRNKMPGDGNIVNEALNLPPIAPKLYDANGNLNFEPRADGSSTWRNPMGYLLKTAKAKITSLIGNIDVGYKILPSLNIKANIGYSETNGRDLSTDPIAAQLPEVRQNYPGETKFGFTNRTTWIIEPQLHWSMIRKEHSLNFLFGTTFQETTTSNQYIRAYGYSTDALIESLTGATDYSIDEYNSQYRYAAIYSRIGYDYKNKYIFNLTGRRDGSSRFGPGNRFGNFGSAAFAWLFSNESFFQNKFKFISLGKLRTSWAITGNDLIGEYQYYNVYEDAIFNYQDGISLSPRSLYNPNYAWEVTTKIEAAAELGFLDDRITVEVNYYKNSSSNQLIQDQLAATSGFSTVTTNFNATVENTGWEFMINSVNINRSKMRWSSTINLSVPKNSLVEFKNIETSSYVNTYKLNEPLTVRFLYTYTGINPQTGEYTFLDVDDNGLMNDNDKRLMLPLQKVYYGGIDNKLSFRGIELSFLFQFVKHYTTRLSGRTSPGAIANQPPEVLDRWQNEDDVSEYGKYTPNYTTNFLNLTRSSFNYENASFVRLKTLAISYSLPQKSSSAIGLQHLSVFLQGQNLWTATNSTNLDPETGIALPPLRILTAGVQMKL